MKYIVLLSVLFISIQVCSQTLTAPISDSNRNIHAVGVVKDISMYPTIEGMAKHVIFLEVLGSEKDMKVEFYAQKEAEVDQCNQHKLMGFFEKKNLDGWGYYYYMFQSEGLVMSTKMGCGSDSKVKKTIMSPTSETVPYRSSLPLVIYAPRGISIMYRLWNTDNKAYSTIVYE